MTTKIDQVREAAEADLETFIRLVHPQRVLGSVHKELIRWWTRSEAKSHSLTLLPRDHGKSAMAGYRAAWEITRNPAIRILYISATENLASKQLKFIKDILSSKVYQRYWPDMINPEEGKREKWTETEISVDHPLRKAEAIRDPTVFVAGLTTNIVGMHCDIAFLDDVITNDNAYTEAGRDRAKTQYSFLSSIEGADSREVVVGTRYHPLDLYNDMMEMKVEIFDEDGAIVVEEPLYEKFEREVETNGEFLWPRQPRYDGVRFGFDANILAKKKAQYLDKTQFYAQYYNNPNDRENAPISAEYFQYYNKSFISRESGFVFFNGRRLNVFAAIDFAYSLSKSADFTSIVVVGVDSGHNYYILDISRFKTNRIKDYFDQILDLHQKWGFRKLRAEVTAAQKVIVEDLKTSYIKPLGLALSIEDFRPTVKLGSKEERIKATLNPRYENLQMWHYQGGNCEVLEEELILERPPHDDIKDSLASAIQIAVAPSEMFSTRRVSNQPFVGRFGGLG